METREKTGAPEPETESSTQNNPTRANEGTMLIGRGWRTQAMSRGWALLLSERSENTRLETSQFETLARSCANGQRGLLYNGEEGGWS